MSKRPYIPYKEYSINVQANMPVAYDFMPLLSQQQEFHSHGACYWLRAHRSESVEDVTYSSRETVIPPNGQVEQEPDDTSQARIRQGSPRPFEDSGFETVSYPLDKLAQDTFRHLNVSELVVKQIGFLYEIPERLQSKPIFDGASVVAHEMGISGNRSNKLREQLGISTYDPYTEQKAKLKNRNRFTSDVSKRLRGHLLTQGLVTDTGVTHYSMAKQGVLGELLNGIHFQDFSNQNSTDFTRDIGIPRTFRLGGGSSQRGRYHELQEKDGIMPG